MKISLLLMFCVLNAYASNVFSQGMTAANMVARIEVHDATVKDLLNEVERSGGISFIYNDELDRKMNKKLSLFSYQHDQYSIEKALNEAGIELKEIEENFFVLLPKPEDIPDPLIAFVNIPSPKKTAEQQQITVTGKVTSADDGEPIPGASVTVRGTTIGTVTDIDGYFSIVVPSEESVLRFSFVGMIRRDIMVGTQRNIDVVLETDAVGLDEVVVTGYGVQRRRDITGSVSSVRSQEIEGMPVTTIQEAIQGRAAGVQVVTSDGVPGGGVTMYIRGQATFSTNHPIWIIDGVEVQRSGIAGRAESSQMLAGLDFNDIESIDILKDAAATAIYGARGANGVIIVTTKRGRSAEKTSFSVNVSRGFTEPTNIKGIMTGPQWAEWDFERYVNAHGFEDSRTQNRLQLGVDRGWYELNPDGTPDFNTTPHYAWLDEVFLGGNIYDARVSASGGDERTRFYTALSHNYTQGHVISYYFDRTSFRLNLDHDATDRLSFDMQLNASVTNQNSTRMAGAHASPYRQGAGTPPVEPIYTWQAEEAGIAHLGTGHPTYFNAPRDVFGAYRIHGLHSAELDYMHARNIKNVASLAASYKFTDNLTYRAAFGVDYNVSDEEQWYDPRAGQGFTNNGALRNYETTAYILQTTQTLNYRNVFADVHELNAVAGFETWERTYTRTAVTGINFPHYSMNVNSVAAEASWFTGSFNERSTMGTFGRLNYTYDDRYMLTLTGRYDASSRFGAQNRWGFFPAIAVGWRMSSESFMAGIEDLDNLMLRVSYGTSGSDAAGAYAAQGLWGGGSQYDGIAGLFPSQLPNEMLTWEENTTLNLAISVGAFRGRLNADIDLFRQRYHNLLLDRPLPVSTGWSSVSDNIGSTRNDGIEVSLNTVNIKRDRFEWSTSINFTFTEMEITELLPGQERFSSSMHLGYPRGMFERALWAGVNTADGRPMYYDKDGNITYNPVFEDYALFGPQWPSHSGGVTNRFQFGNFSASVFFQYAGNGTRYISDHRHWFTGTGDRNQYSWVYERRWLEPGQITDVPRPMNNNAYEGNALRPNSNVGSHMYDRNDYTRLKDVTLQYRLPRSVTDRLRMDNVRVYARGTNLYVWTDYSGIDPEFTGSDQGVYPQARSITIGINTNF